VLYYDYGRPLIVNRKEMDILDIEKVRQNLIRLRGKRSQSSIAKDLGIATSTYGMYELGKRIPSDDVKIKIAKLYHKTVQYIFFS
jgi:putative transcriptional regulator